MSFFDLFLSTTAISIRYIILESGWYD
jgi:hypothetical protein